MANLQERRDKSGKLIAYSVRVYRGRGADGKQLKPWTTTFDVLPTWSEKTALKKAQVFSANFEKECKEGRASDTHLTFEQYCRYVVELKEERGQIKHKTAVRYKELAERIYPIIGFIKLRELRTDHLNDLYTALGKPGTNKYTGGSLSAKTILEHHRLISTVLDTACKEMLIPSNPAKNATLPKAEKKDVNYFQPEDVANIRKALETEPIKWRAMTELLIMSGCRRGELLGLKWENVDFELCRIFICNNIMYSPDRGIYETTPKTKQSIRYVRLPGETIKLLKTYQAWQSGERLRLGEYYDYQGFVFSQDNGKPLHPDSVTDWLKKFSKRHELPHINPHAFRHTMASMLIYNGMDTVSVSHRLGHAQVSTTENIYAHVIADADERSSDILEDIFAKRA